MEPKDKRQVVEEMLAKGDTMICLDSRCPGVRVPENHKGREDLRLILNLNFRHSITTSSDGIQAELVFGGVPFLCWIPYESLWAVYNPQTGEGYLWPGRTPVSLQDLLERESGGERPKGDVSPATRTERPGSGSPEKVSSGSAGKVDRTRAPGKPGRSGTGPADKVKRLRFRVIDGGRKD